MSETAQLETAPPAVLVEIASIWIAEDRQRKMVMEVDELWTNSISKVGLLNPIIIKAEPGPNGELFKLVAGERRLRAHIFGEQTHILARNFADLDRVEQELVELHENIKRNQLTWQEEVLAVNRYKKIREEQGASATINLLVMELGLPARTVRRHLDLGPCIDPASASYEERIAKAESCYAAHNVIEKRRERARAAATAELLSDVTGGLVSDDGQTASPAKPKETLAQAVDAAMKAAAPARKDEAKPGDPPRKPLTAISDAPIVNGDFIAFSDNYSGPRFSFLHCDFPYGIDFEGAQTAKVEGSHHTTYDDSPDVYWSLVAALCRNTPRLCEAQAHMMFWFDMRYYQQTLDYFAEHSDWTLVTPNPLVWLKTDRAGIASDVERRPRHILEYALMFSRGDRKILKVMDDGIDRPSQRSSRTHRSEKPEPVLRHFFEMFVDDMTSVLDPTCGSGTSLVVADELGAKMILGIELDHENFVNARARFSTARNLRLLSGKGK